MKHYLFIAVAAVWMLSGCGQVKMQPKILVHRGLCTTADKITTDENTLDALRRAQEAGVDGVEFDVQMTADGYLIIRHDPQIEGQLHCQKSNFEEIRAYRLPFGNQIPTLQEWLDQAKMTPDIVLCLEIKAHATPEIEAQVVAKTIAEVNARNMMEQVYFLTFNPETGDEILKQAPEARVILNSNSLHHSLPPCEVASRGFKGISYGVETTLNHPDWIKESHNLGLKTFMWMVETPYLRDIASSLGSDWITTDFFDEVRP